MNLIKSKKRVADHGEVFTPPWLVEQMLDLGNLGTVYPLPASRRFAFRLGFCANYGDEYVIRQIDEFAQKPKNGHSTRVTELPA